MSRAYPKLLPERSCVLRVWHPKSPHLFVTLQRAPASEAKASAMAAQPIVIKEALSVRAVILVWGIG